MMFKPFFLIGVLCLTFGCAAKNKSAFDGVSATNPTATDQIAQDAANHLAAIYPPGRTSIAVNTDSQFGIYLEDALRQRGFIISGGGIPIQYQVDMLKGEATPTCYMTLRLPDGGIIAQSYTVAGGLVVANSNVAKTGVADYTPASFIPPPAPALPITPAPVAPPAPMYAQAPTPTPAPVSPVVTALPNINTATAQATALPPVAKREIAATAPTASAVVAQNKPVTTPAIAAALADVHKSTSSPATPTAAASTPVVAKPPVVAPVAPVAMAQTLPALPPPVVSTMWQIKPGMLRPQIETWAEKAGYQVIWEATHDFDMQSTANFHSDFVEAIQRLFTRLHLHGNPLRVTVYKENNVLVVRED